MVPQKLPALPDDLHSLQLDSIPGDHIQRPLDLSPTVSPILEAQSRASLSSFCVSPIRDEDHFPEDARQETRIPSSSPPIPQADYDGTPAHSRVQPVQPPQHYQDSRRFISGKLTRWDNFAAEPNDFGIASQVDTRNTSFYKASGAPAFGAPTSNRSQGFNPKKTLNAARHRISSFSKHEDLSQKVSRSRSTSRVFPVEEHSSKRNGNGALKMSPQLDNFSFAPTTVTTITAGGPVSFPRRPVTEHAPIRLPEEDKPLLHFDNDFGDLMLTSDESRSRFSATTYTATEPGSQDASPRESLQLETRSTDDVSISSIMARRRPVPPGVTTSTKPARKPTPSQVEQPVGQMPARSLSPPPEVPLDAQGRIKAMETKRDNLAQRKYSLETLIAELSKAIQPTSAAYDLAAKAEVQKSINDIEGEIADIKKEEHDLGMKIARAWRRLDEKENSGDGNNLWVKRVTS
ncbi:hypothetical protein PDIG_80540 [Penicillium digitatum PHI26]|uniref:Uncharacterized protein n=2 Tax=Penicillium digitatum TaxID=36651 RepID=K9FCN4_PEND2|nr:hypothetical protein PDIP_28930 [Penicillium digitatum Pd1]EKV05857.1 hypothetical protein PDIG_80540 [Penicillium digitatum PHI26]EKV17984.1 hypothetical protein PDIP_28930 [Penicillium digitatum Pd1]